MNARRPLLDVIVCNRPNSLRNIANFKEMHELLEKEMHLAVKVIEPGPLEVCQQVRLVAEADVLLNPHGSQNVAVLFSCPSCNFKGFPLLDYIDWLFVHAGKVYDYELYGTWTTERSGMPFQICLYAVLLGWKRCFSVRGCMNYGKRKDFCGFRSIRRDFTHPYIQLSSSSPWIKMSEHVKHN